MSIAIDHASLGEATVTTGTATPTINTNATAPSGALIVLAVANDGPNITVSSVSGGGLSWSVDKQDHNTTSGDNVALCSAYAASGLTSGTTITVTLSAATASILLSLTSFTGTASSSYIDGTPISATQATAAWSSGNYTTSGEAVVVSASEVDTSTSNTTTSPSVEAHDFQEATSGNTLAVEYRIDTTAGTRTVQGTWASGSDGVVVAVAYKVAAGGGTRFFLLVRR